VFLAEFEAPVPGRLTGDPFRLSRPGGDAAVHGDGRLERYPRTPLLGPREPPPVEDSCTVGIPTYAGFDTLCTQSVETARRVGVWVAHGHHDAIYSRGEDRVDAWGGLPFVVARLERDVQTAPPRFGAGLEKRDNLGVRSTKRCVKSFA